MASACRSVEQLIWSATRLTYGRLDAALSRVDLGRTDYYVGFLRGQAEALFPLEAALEVNGVDQLLPDWPQRARTAALEHDLATLDIACDPLPVPRLGDDGEASAEMLGVLYVLEGMRLAGRGLLQRLAERRAVELVSATAYLRHGFGRRFWPDFVQVLESHPAAHRDAARVIEGARLAFSMFDSAVTPTLLGTLDRARSTLRLVSPAPV